MYVRNDADLPPGRAVRRTGTRAGLSRLKPHTRGGGRRGHPPLVLMLCAGRPRALGWLADIAGGHLCIARRTAGVQWAPMPCQGLKMMLLHDNCSAAVAGGLIRGCGVGRAHSACKRPCKHKQVLVTVRGVPQPPPARLFGGVGWGALGDKAGPRGTMLCCAGHPGRAPPASPRTRAEVHALPAPVCSCVLAATRPACSCVLAATRLGKWHWGVAGKQLQASPSH